MVWKLKKYSVTPKKSDDIVWDTGISFYDGKFRLLYFLIFMDKRKIQSSVFFLLFSKI